MFARLRHNAFIRGNYKKNGVNSPRASQHVIDEIPVTWNIHNADFLSRREIQPGKTQINGHLAFFFLAQTVRIDPGQRLDQCGFAMVDVPGSSDYMHCCVTLSAQKRPSSH